ncbi:TetR family transcriptional regulator [Leptolyngbya sp. FACHB-261]|uniref:TetR family transcriptional regulator n=1 Tax=Leptolyngbya sp. FACHB-261 TaxID=2692806 RepID=UPI001684ECEF|nr:TetR family transcriptional regulator [Leptolyngbya sp. FACHB-261]MBD2103674.1 TetR family transcriptional regulator [Leptolyngbya sp. FACHB-261]
MTVNPAALPEQPPVTGVRDRRRVSIRTRQKIIDAALELFARQGVTETTTRQIAERAGVNEVTLFRHFGNKHGLLLATIQECEVFTSIGQSLMRQTNWHGDPRQELLQYVDTCLQALEEMPDLVRSVVGESGQYPEENRQALGQGFVQANRALAACLASAVRAGQLQLRLAPENLASLINSTILGYAVVEVTCRPPDMLGNLWAGRGEFLESLVDLFLQGAELIGSPPLKTAHLELAVPSNGAEDLGASVSHSILAQAKKAGAQDYALAWVLFGAGLTVAEVLRLRQGDYSAEPDWEMLRVCSSQGTVRQVPINQKILGRQVATANNSPLSRYLRRRGAGPQPSQPLFTLTEAEVLTCWQQWTNGFTNPDATPLRPDQARQSWCVDMLCRGVEPANLEILSGLDTAALAPFIQRAREKAALSQAVALDQ